MSYTNYYSSSIFCSTIQSSNPIYNPVHAVIGYKLQNWSISDYRTFSLVPENETNLAKISSSDLHTVGVLLSTYPSVIFDVDISSFVNKGFHCVLMAFTSCSMQGSSLREKQIFQWQYDSKTDCYCILVYQITRLWGLHYCLMRSCYS